jgi:hypothetical protein
MRLNPRGFEYAERASFLFGREHLQVEHAYVLYTCNCNRRWDISLSIGRLNSRRFDGLLTALEAEDHSYYPLFFKLSSV